MLRTWKEKSPLDWRHVAANFDPACQGTVSYVMDISEGNTEDIPVFATMMPTSSSALVRTVTPTFIAIFTPNVTATATITPSQTATQTETPTVTPTMTIIPTLVEEN